MLGVAWLVLVFLAMVVGETSTYDGSTVVQALLAMVGLGDAVEGAHHQTIVQLRLWRALSAGGVGACLALAGVMLQGLFRNGLAAPSLIGVTSGASVGATFAILLIGGYGPRLMLNDQAHLVPYLVTLCAFGGAVAVGLVILGLATRGGMMSVATLLLVGVAINSCLSGVLVAIQSLVLKDSGVTQAILAWTFGTLDDRRGYHVVVVAIGLAMALLVVPRIATELDLLAGGEDDAQSLGVDLKRIRRLVLAAAALTTACAVATSGQIVFIGLVVPHILRRVVGSAHGPLLWTSVFGGAVFLLATDLLQVVLLGRRELPPGVVMALIGGPMLFFLIVRERRTNLSW